jgi:hypothetical protein
MMMFAEKSVDKQKKKNVTALKQRRAIVIQKKAEQKKAMLQAAAEASEAAIRAIAEAPLNAEKILKDVIRSIESKEYDPYDYMDRDFDQMYATRKRDTSYLLYRAPTDQYVKDLLIPKINQLGYTVTESQGCYNLTCGFHIGGGCCETIWLTIQRTDLWQKKIDYDTDLIFPEKNELFW